METLWFVLVTFMLAAYVVLDGFDLGAGIIHLFVARTEEQRSLVLKAIGPFWDGNEVWLLAAGGTLFFAFPVLYASSFSGFYLPLMIVLWLLMLRAIGIEFRAHVESELWHSFFDVVFSISSLLLTVFFGAAIGNVVRGVPLDKEGYFFEPLWTTFTVSPYPGILDWYTILIGLLAFFALGVHGACYIATKTEGALNARARRMAKVCWLGVANLTVVGLVATLKVRPQMFDNYRMYWPGAIFPILSIASLAGILYFCSKENDRASFLSSSAFIVGMLGGAAFGLYPNMLPASTDPAFSLTIHNSAAARYGLSVGIVWWAIGMALALGYFTYLYRSFRGKVTIEIDP